MIQSWAMTKQIVLNIWMAIAASVLLTKCSTMNSQSGPASTTEVAPPSTDEMLNFIHGLSRNDVCGDVVTKLEAMGFTSMGTMKPL